MDRLLEGLDVIALRGDATSTAVESIAFDARSLRPGALFCCIVGEHSDGHDFAAGALARGARALLVERPLHLDVAQVQVAPGAVRPIMAELACRISGNPASDLKTVGVTGTNGKTTVTQMLRSIFEAGGLPTEVIGTLDGALTTPEAPELQQRLARARDEGKLAAALEVSSHAIVQSRVDGIRFSAAVFTNLSQDHLDFHRTMEEYFEAKARLFTPERAELAVVNADDPHGALLLERARVPTVAFRSSDASEVSASVPGRTTFRWHGREITLGLSGAFNVVNALAAATTARALGMHEEVVVEGLREMQQVPGRFEIVAGPAPFTVVVDYAHTPAGLGAALDSARELAGTRRVLCVFGCGGGRDRAKRPVMGEVAAAKADVVVVTSDNPRDEDRSAIIDDVLSGIAERSMVVVEPERAAAISTAISMADEGDVVVVAGKGHETYIEEDGKRVAFDDRLQAARSMAALGRLGPGAR